MHTMHAYRGFLLSHFQSNVVLAHGTLTESTTEKFFNGISYPPNARGGEIKSVGDDDAKETDNAHIVDVEIGHQEATNEGDGADGRDSTNEENGTIVSRLDTVLSCLWECLESSVRNYLQHNPLEDVDEIQPARRVDGGAVFSQIGSQGSMFGSQGSVSLTQLAHSETDADTETRTAPLLSNAMEKLLAGTTLELRITRTAKVIWRLHHYLCIK